MIEVLEPVPAADGAAAIAALYCRYARRLEQIVRLGVDAPAPVIEDACQFAWSRLVCHGHRIRRETALPWLVTTAVHQAVKLTRREQRELSLENMLERASDPLENVGIPGPEEILEHREQLTGIRLLPERQRRLVWLQVLGLSYEEMAAREACTVRTVERQLTRARRTMRLRSAA